MTTTLQSQETNPITKQVGGTHYNNSDVVIQPIVYCELNKLTPLESKVVKYVSRHRRKNGSVDLDKAIHCLQMLKDLEYGDRNLLKETVDNIEKFLKEDEE